MPQIRILDTFAQFAAIWNKVQHEPVNVQIEAWLEKYMAQFPELLNKQLEDYAGLNEDWRGVASERIFPALGERFSVMQTAHAHLSRVCIDIYERAGKAINFNTDLVCVIYVGIGCGAGWADEYGGKPAILFGLENIAEEGWQGRDALSGLVAHELGHLFHFEQRKKSGLPDEENHWWRLYIEGFAQRCECTILGKPSWHMQTDPEKGWQNWCGQNLGWLAREFVRRVDEGDDMRPFFGSWFSLRGHKQTGYFLGQELIAALQKQMSLEKIALLTDVESHLRPLLAQMA